MLEREIYHYYQLYVDKRLRIGDYDGFRAHGHYYIVVPLQNRSMQSLQDMQYMITYLNERGVNDIPQWIPNQKGKWTSSVEGNDVLLFQLPRFEKNERNTIGSQLGEFHRAGEQIPISNQESLRYNEWVPLWSSRLDQLKERYEETRRAGVNNEFDYLFVDSFPYYEGLTENAIQYIVDYEWDRKSKEEGSYTITHERFHPNTWIPVKKEDNLYSKMPLFWVIDHPVRDVAEYIRFLVTQKATGEEISTFLSDYTKEKPLTRGGWRLLYGRLLYPSTYLDTVESYFISNRSQLRKDSTNRLNYVLSVEENQESFMKNFFNISAIPMEHVNIEPVGWLTKA
ncbi:spore coat putative kinase YutH [Alkalihalobacillus sp. AL-G]|uniref:spore coat putative kinase YutH n=1 Tax=Alkalihalobacillus sp. AL-G TaxID=2926399 RepID=UPI00272CA424|nr:spore coat protein YutH [Alkalihalobacillus sp. AL-G]WLD92688.1 spore coat protein YutH [Alkalihalobacillus sp. AL-G]